jgi:hypothetical protein
MMTHETKLAGALLDPQDFYKTPNDVLSDPDLTEPQKIEVLRRWEYDASEVSVAEEEGMAHTDGITLYQVLQALHQLVPDIDSDRRPPTKQGGLDRGALGSHLKKA